MPIHDLRKEKPMKKVLVCLVMVVSAVCVHAQMGDSVEKQVLSLEQKWAQAQKASDADAIAPLLADKFVMVFPDGRVMTKAQALDDTRKSKMDSVEASELKVTSYGDTAIVVGIWKGKGIGGDGKPEDESERFVDTWHKAANGQWQCVASGNTKM
jgi:ketosteroid isomerase-like protein